VVTVPGPERLPPGERGEEDRTSRSTARDPWPGRTQHEIDRARALGERALEGAGIRDPDQVRAERAQRIAPALGRAALRENVELVTERQPLSDRGTPPVERAPQQARPESRER
jgi:hypothetical protein